MCAVVAEFVAVALPEVLDVWVQAGGVAQRGVEVGREDLMPGTLAPDPRPVHTDPLHCSPLPSQPPRRPGSGRRRAARPSWPGSSGTIRTPLWVGRHPKVHAEWRFASRR